MPNNYGQAIRDAHRNNPDLPPVMIAKLVGCSVEVVYKHSKEMGLKLPRNVNLSGITCEVCGGNEISVTDSRPATYVGLPTVRRRRACACGHKFTTHEVRDTDLEEIDRLALREAAKGLVISLGLTSSEILDLVIEARAEQ